MITIKDFVEQQTKDKPKSKIKKFGSLEEKLNLYYYKNFINDELADKYFKLFEEKINWDPQEGTKIIINKQELYVNRKQASYCDNDISYSRSWNNNDEICQVIRKLRDKVELFTGAKFNFVLINRYNDGTEQINYHNDKEVLGLKSVQVAGISFGAVRHICFKPIKEKFIYYEKLPNKIKIPLTPGSLYVMNYPTNQNWKHAIPKQIGVKTPRISLTFRWFD